MNSISDLYSIKRKGCRKQLLIASVHRKNCSESFETFTDIPLHSGCYLHNTLDYFVCSIVG